MTLERVYPIVAMLFRELPAAATATGLTHGNRDEASEAIRKPAGHQTCDNGAEILNGPERIHHVT
jgi:hypothetical protein